MGTPALGKHQMTAQRLQTRRHPWVAKNPDLIPAASAAALDRAMMLEGLPATDRADLLWIMAQESMGVVGVRNQSGSTARGLYQLLEGQWAAYYPHGAKSIGNAVEECQGGIRYIKDRYQTVANARAFWNRHHWY